MSLLVDKHRPRSLKELNYHQELSERIISLASSGGDFPHILFYGPSGAGKKTRVNCTLKELYGSGAEKIRIDQRVFVTPSKRKLDVNVVQSNYHIELTPSDVGIYDRVVTQDILKEIAQTQQVDLNAKRRFKVVVINEADLLTRDAQSALRRTMEKYSTNLRIILCANSTSRIIGPIRSRCLLLRVAAPTDGEVTNVLKHVANKEGLNLPDHVAQIVSKNSAGNLRRALLSLDALHTMNPQFSNIPPDAHDDPDLIPRPDWERYISNTASKILAEQSPERLLEIRSMLYELLVHCIPPTLIISTLAKRLVERVDDDEKANIIQQAAFFEHRVKLGSKPIFHLEAFVAKIMSMHKNFLLGLIDDWD